MTSTSRDEPVVTFAKRDPASDWATSDERVPLFTVERDGQEPRVYSMPAKPNAGLTLEYLRQGRKLGAELAASWIIETAIGEEGYDALVDELSQHDGNPQELLRSLIERIQVVAMGGLEVKKD